MINDRQRQLRNDISGLSHQTAVCKKSDFTRRWTDSISQRRRLLELREEYLSPIQAALQRKAFEIPDMKVLESLGANDLREAAACLLSGNGAESEGCAKRVSSEGSDGEQRPTRFPNNNSHVARPPTFLSFNHHVLAFIYTRSP